MGDPKGFMHIARRDPSKRPVARRLRDHKEITIPLSDKEIEQQAARCMDCGIPFCHGFGCPVANLVPEFNDLVYRGHWRAAFDVLHSRNPFPEITGRVCPALCESACVCNIDEEPVSIRQIEMAIVERGFSEGWFSERQRMPPNGCRIAVVGSGPAGLAAADYLNRGGFEVTVYEKNHNPGGILWYGIPDFKLPKKIVARRCALMEKEGVAFITGVMIGQDISLSYLRKGFDAVVLAMGTEVPRDVAIPGRGLAGIHFAMEYLARQNRINNGERVAANDSLDARGKRVLVIGGGDTGADCVGTANRQGAKKVTQVEILPEPPKVAAPETWPHYPAVLRTSTSHEEGCKRLWSIGVKKFVGRGSAVAKADAVRLRWSKPGGNGRRRCTEVRGSRFAIPCDLVLIAAGFVQASCPDILAAEGISLSERGFVRVEEGGGTAKKKLYCAGDAASGPSLVVHAIQSGLATARCIDAELSR